MTSLSPPDRVRGVVRTARRIGGWRLAATGAFLVGATVLARYSWSLPLGVDAERALYDVRMLMAAPRVTQDDRIVMVAFTDQTLEHTGKRSPLDRALLARALHTLDGLGARAIGIDILIDEAQPDDQRLIDALRGMKTPVRLAFAANASNAAVVQPWQEAFMRSFQAKLAPARISAASVRIEADPDGVVRSWPHRPAGLPPLLASALVPQAKAFADYHRSLLYRLPRARDRPVFAALPIDLFADPGGAPVLKRQIAGRYVLVGGDISDIDQFDTPATRLSGRTSTGLELHATMLAQLLDGRLPPVLPNWSLWVAAMTVVGAATAAAITERPPVRAAFVVAGSVLLLIGSPIGLQQAGWDTQGLPVAGWLGGWTLAFLVAGSAARALGSEQRRFAQSALGKYLPRDVATAILRDPERLSLHGEKRDLTVVFTDLEGFTSLSHRIEPEQVASLLNAYLDMLSEIVLTHGGTLDKFVGDAVIAFWGAPIARPDDTDRAVAAALAMAQAGERFRCEARPGIPPIGQTRIGVHRGEAVVGNFGGEGRIQYTALGDSMNTASRLEGANKQLDTNVLVSGDVVARSSLACFRPLGRVSVRGRATPIEIFEALDRPDPSATNALALILQRFDQGDRSAMGTLQIYMAERPGDAALSNLLRRLEVAGPGGCFALD